MSRTSPVSGSSLLLCAGLLHIGIATAAPITFNTALPVAKGRFVGRLQAIQGKSRHDPSRLARKFEARTALGVLGYGVSPKLAVFGALPYTDKALRVGRSDSDTHGTSRSTRGIGDARLFARYTVVQLDEPGRTFRLAPFLGLELPTGANRRRDDRGHLPAALQPGTGALDLFGGLIATRQTLDYQVDAQVAYQHNRQADGFQPGDVLRADLSLQYRLWPRELDTGVPGFTYGVLEANLIHQRKNRISVHDDPDSGGTTLFLSPGLQYVTRRWIFEAAVQLPVAERTNSDGLEPGRIVRAGVRINF